MTVTYIPDPEPFVSFFVEGKPEPQGSKVGRPIYAKGRGCKCCTFTGRVNMVESAKLVKPWRRDVAGIAGVQMARHEILREPVVVIARFYMPRPSHHWATGRNAGQLRPSAPEHHTQKPDVDKLLRAVLDALTGVVYADDSQVVEAFPRKRWNGPGQPEGVRITVKLAPG